MCIRDRDIYTEEDGEPIESQGKVLSVEEIARLMTRVSEEKYHGMAFTFNYMIDEIAEAIHKAQKGEI